MAESDGGQLRDGPMPPEEEAIREALARVAASDAFRNAPQLTAFLTFVVGKALAGEAQEIKGYTIATQALGRSPSFDPQTDPIVRVEAGRLRRALQAYYQGPGAADPVRIEVPRGTYVPRLVPADGAAESAAESTAEPDDEADGESESDGDAEGIIPAVGGSVADRAAAPARFQREGWHVVLALVALALLAGGLAWFESSRSGPERELAARAQKLRTGSLAAERSEGRPVVVVAPVEAGDPAPPGLSPERFRSLVLDSLARFDEITVVDQKTGTARTDPQRYVLNLRMTAAGGPAGGPAVVARLMQQPSGKVIWTRGFELPGRAGTASAPEVDVAHQIATTIGQPYGVLFADLRTRPNIDPRTRCIIRAYDYWNRQTARSHAEVRACLEAVIAADPADATAQADLAYLCLDEYRAGFNPKPDPLERALQAARKAIEIAPDSPRANRAMMAVSFVRGDVEQALRYGRRALELNPYDTDVMADLGARYVELGRYEEGTALIKRAADANPADPPWYDFFLFLAAYMEDDFGEARMAASRIVAADYPLGLVAKAIVAGQEGDAAKAKSLTAQLVALQPEFGRDPRSALARRSFAPQIVARLSAGLHKAGLPI